MDIIRYVGGGMLKNVRGIAGRWNPTFDVEGDYSAFMEFENGTGVLVSFIGYGHFEGAELTWGLAEGGTVRPEQTLIGPRRKPTGPVPTDEFYARDEFSTDSLRGRIGRQPQHQDFFGLNIVSCERGDIRQSPDGIYVYTEDGRSEMLVSDMQADRGSAEVRELKESIDENRPVFPNEGWGRASLEGCLGILESSRTGQQVELKYQVPSPIQPAPLGTGGHRA
jgi:phthalate 4,5-cis-dihydrodiol dehydrogenase